MNASKESNRNRRYVAVDLRRSTLAVHARSKFTMFAPLHIAATAVCRRWPVVILLLLAVQVAAPFLCADGITFDNTSGVFNAPGFIGVPSNSAVAFAPRNPTFAVVPAGYFVPSLGSQTISTNFNQTSGPTASGVGIVPAGGSSSETTIIPAGGGSFGTTIIPDGGSASETTLVPEPASLWLVGIGFAILVLFNYRNRAVDRRV